jgi:Tol biopolymer transport system component
VSQLRFRIATLVLGLVGAGVRRIAIAAGCAVLVALVVAPSAFALGAATTLESRDSAGTRVGGNTPSVSADGRYVTFMSAANSIVPGDTNGTTDYFLRDRVTGQTRAITVGPDGTPVGANPQRGLEISADGRSVAFTHTAPPLLPGTGSNDRVDLFLWDRPTGALRRFPVPGDQFPAELAIDADGSRVAFSAGDQVYVADTTTGAMLLVSRTPAGLPGNDSSGGPAISADGNWVAFGSAATNLVSGVTPGQSEVLVGNVATGELTRASVGAGAVNANGRSEHPSISADGCAIAFTSYATNLVAGDSGTTPKVFVRDRCDGTTERVSITNDATGNQRHGESPDISDDGCLVAFVSASVYPSPPAGWAAVLRDRCAGTTTRLDLSTNGDAGGGVETPVRLSGGSARYAVFTSYATTLVAGDDPDGLPDVFLRDRADRNLPPVAALTLTRDGSRVTADATASHDPDAPTVTGSIAFGDGTPDRDGVIATHEYGKSGTYAVTVTIRDADGATATQTQIVTVPAAGGSGPPPSDPTPGGGKPRPSSGQVVQGISLSRTRFKVAPRRGRPKSGQGTTLTVRLRAAATVSLRFDRMLKGRRSGGKCSARARKGKRCTIYRSTGRLTRRLKAGASAVALSGRIGSRRLAPGAYRLTVSAGGGQRSLAFTILRGS